MGATAWSACASIPRSQSIPARLSACGHLRGVQRPVPVGQEHPPWFSAGEQYLARSGRLSAATTPGRERLAVYLLRRRRREPSTRPGQGGAQRQKTGESARTLLLGQKSALVGGSLPKQVPAAEVRCLIPCQTRFILCQTVTRQARIRLS